MNILIGLLVSGIVGTAIFIILLLIRPISEKQFSKTWHFYSLLVPLIFFLGGTAIAGTLVHQVSYFRYERNNSMSGATQPQNHSEIHLSPFLTDSLDVTVTPNPTSRSYDIVRVLGFVARNSPYILLCWMLGAVLFIGISVKKYMTYRRLVLYDAKPYPDITCEIPVVISRTAHTPMLVGIIKPVIVLPQIPLKDDELKIILTHEMIHYKRKDLWFKMASFVANAVHWFNPAVYFLNRQLNILCELSCDEKVASEMDVGERKFYVETILQVLQHGTTQIGLMSNLMFATSLCNSQKNIKRRLITMMNAKRMKKCMAIFSLIIAALVVGAGFVLSYAGSVVQTQADEIEMNRYYDFDDHCPTLFVEAQSARPVEQYVPAQPTRDYIISTLANFDEALGELGLIFDIPDPATLQPRFDVGDSFNLHIGRLSPDIPVRVASEADVDLLLEIARVIISSGKSGFSWDTSVDTVLAETGLESYFMDGMRKLTQPAREQSIIHLATNYTADELVAMGYFPWRLELFQSYGFFLDYVFEP